MPRGLLIPAATVLRSAERLLAGRRNVVEPGGFTTSGTGRAFLMMESFSVSARWFRHLISTMSPGLCPPKTRGSSIPAVTGLLYTSVFVNPTLLGAIGSYYNSVCGLTLTLAPTKNTYFQLRVLRREHHPGRADGHERPTFQRLLFQHLGSRIGLDHRRQIPRSGRSGALVSIRLGTAAKCFTGWDRRVLHVWQSAHLVEPYRNRACRRRGRATSEKQDRDRAGAFPALIHLDVLAIRCRQRRGAAGQSILWNGLHRVRLGAGPARRLDGVGMSWGWLNPKAFDRASELMFQGYYQAHLVAGTFFQPAVSYIPTPGASASLGGAWA